MPIRGIAAGLAGWLGIMALTALAVQPETVVALGNPMALAIADDGLLLSAGRAYLVIRPIAPHAVWRLYTEGAWLVLPAPGTGCVAATLPDRAGRPAGG